MKTLAKTDLLHAGTTVIVHDHTGRTVAVGTFWSWIGAHRWSEMLMDALQDGAYAEMLDGCYRRHGFGII